MSGQPYKTKLDMVTARKAYLANLNLRAELDDLNLQANKTYISTGQLPATPPDNRTLTEKLADVQRLKIELRNKLSDITDGLQANAIVENLNPDQLVFLSQNFEPISQQMRQNYALGVQSDIFVDYLNRYINKFNETKGVEFNLQQSTGKQLLANQKNIINNMANIKDISTIQDLIIELGQQNSRLGKSIFQNLNELENIVSNLPDTFVEFQKTDNAIRKSEILNLVNNIVQELPTKEELNKITKELEKIKKSKDTVAITSLLEKLDSLTKSGVDVTEEMQILREVLNKPQPVKKSESSQPQPQSQPQSQPEPQTAEAQFIASSYKSIDKELKTRETLIKYYIEMYEILNGSKDNIGNYSEQIIGTSNYKGAKKNQLLKLVEVLNTDLRIRMFGEDNPGLVQFYGRGLQRRIRTSQVFDSDIDYTKAVKAGPKFIPIGRYLINKRQLDKDIIAIKRPAGSIINGLPSQRVSKNSANIIRKIIGGGVPNYNELNELNDEERIFLNKVVKETRIDDKITIPTPNKTDDEKDINQFEIMKGQILAGNDNKDLVKNFKIIILKLSKKDLIPKVQVNELLMDLATLGH